MRLTGGKCLEHDLLEQVLTAYERILKDNQSMRTLLQKADADFHTIGEINSMQTPMLHPEYGTQIIDVKTKQWRYHDLAVDFFKEEDYDD